MTALRSARNGYLEATTVAGKINSYSKICSCMEDVKSIVSSGAMPSGTEKELNAYFSSYNTAVLDISRQQGTYNNSVSKYLNTVQSVPASLFAAFAGIPNPEYL